MAFRFTAAILIAGATLHVATLWPAVTAMADTLPRRAWIVVAGFAVSAGTALLACALAALLLWKAADRPDGRALTLFLGFLSLFWGSLFRFMSVSGEEDSISVMVSYGGGFVSQSALIALLLAGAAFLRFAALFPRPLTADRLPPARRAMWLRRLRQATLRPLPVWGAAALVIAAETWLIDVVAYFAPDNAGTTLWMPLQVALWTWVGLYIAYLATAIAVGLRNLRTSYRIATPAERSRMQWLLAGFRIAAWMAVGAIGIILLIVMTDLGGEALGAAIPLVLVLAPLVIVLCATVGVLYSGAIDTALVLQKSTIYGALGAIAVVTFAGIENALSNLLEQRLGLPGIFGAMVAGGLVTAALIPLRNLLMKRVHRRATGADESERPQLPSTAQ
jgi:hypothetical protein